MSDLISRQAAIKYLMTNMNWYDEDGYESNDDCKRECITELINGVPPAQPKKIRGKWIKVGRWGRVYKCNRCGNLLDFDGVNAGRGSTNFCPNCGAKMDGGDENEID